MPIVNGRNIPDSITSVKRNTSTLTVKVLTNPRVPTLDDPSTYTLVDRNITVGQSVKTRRMIQKTNPKIFFEFDFPPVQVGYDGMGVDVVEIQRPILRPLVEVKASKNYKAVFEFLVADRFDGLSNDVEEKLGVLEKMANYGEPVYFENFDGILTSGFWYIAEFSVKVSRVNVDGKIVSAQCSIGVIEYANTEKRFASLPKISYKAPRRGRGTGGSSTTGGTGDTDPDDDLNNGANQGGAAVTIPVTVVAPPTIPVYRYRRSSPPPAAEGVKPTGFWNTDKIDNKIVGYWFDSPAPVPICVSQTTRTVINVNIGSPVHKTKIRDILNSFAPQNR